MSAALAELLAAPGLAPVLAALPQARLVGGCVRDALARLPVADIDLATPEPPEAVQAALRDAGLRVLPTGLAHGTVTALSAGHAFEVTTLRRDVSTDGRHAEVAWTTDWREDAARRDFTINAMSLDRRLGLHDPFGGEADLRAGRVRFVGEAARRIAEDRLRMLRFFRFGARYGRGDPDPQACDAIAGAAPELALLSPERVWSELRRLLAAPDPSGAVALMARLEVLAAMLPEGADPEALQRLVATGAPPDPLLRLAALLRPDAASPAERLRLAGTERDRLAALRGVPAPTPGLDGAARRRLLAQYPVEVLVARTWLTGDGGPGWTALRAELEATPRPVFPLEGRDVLAAGLAPGPAVGGALRAVREWWLAGGCVAGRAECLARLGRELGS